MFPIFLLILLCKLDVKPALRCKEIFDFSKYNELFFLIFFKNLKIYLGIIEVKSHHIFKVYMT